MSSLRPAVSCGSGVGVISMFGVAVSSGAGVFVAPKTIKLFSCCGCWVACGIGVFTTVGVPVPNMDRTIITIISTRIKISPMAIIIGVLSWLRLLFLLPLLYAGLALFFGAAFCAGRGFSSSSNRSALSVSRCLTPTRLA